MLGGTLAELGNAYLRFSIGKKIETIRTERGMPCEVMAGALGISKTSLKDYELGKASIPTEQLFNMLIKLDISKEEIEEFFGEFRN